MAVPGDQERTPHRFPSALRLHLPAEFRNVFAHATVVRDSAFKILRSDNLLSHCRLGLAVSRKTCRSAVGRNRIKRVVRESFRHHRHELDARGSWDIVVLPTPQAATICNAELSTRLAALWQKMRTPQTGAADKQNRNSH